MSFLILNKIELCPACRQDHCVKSYGECRRCGMMLFLPGYNFKKYAEDTGWRELWFYSGSIEGWKHFSHTFDNAQPLTREISTKMPAPNNSTTPEEVQARGGKIKAMKVKR